MLISLVAVGISIFAYNTQRAADGTQNITDQVAISASEQQYARFVSTWLVSAGDGEIQIVVQNLSSAPVSQVAVNINVVQAGTVVVAPLQILVGTIPACKTATVTEKTDLTNGTPVKWVEGTVTSLTFIDVNGVYWTRHASGTLTPSHASPLGNNIWMSNPDTNVELTDAQGCE